LDVVQAYMSHIQHNAELAVRRLLKEVELPFKLSELESATLLISVDAFFFRVASKEKNEKGLTKLHAMDLMDDGTPICLTIEIDEKTVGLYVAFCKGFGKFRLRVKTAFFFFEDKPDSLSNSSRLSLAPCL
uniref:Hydantoinase_B domain-containing protein n=1 Tax=Gongylonema pulchrum TaxID=637853 RepID=A0A183DBZ9_9BILA